MSGKRKLQLVEVGESHCKQSTDCFSSALFVQGIITAITQAESSLYKLLLAELQAEPGNNNPTEAKVSHVSSIPYHSDH
jgi:hypothetical protein